MTEKIQTTDFREQAEKMYNYHFETATIPELEIEYQKLVAQTKIQTDRWGKPLYQAKGVCAICGVHCHYSYGHAPQVVALIHGKQQILNSTYCPDHYQLVMDRDDIKEAIELRKHGIIHQKEIKKDHLVQRYREKAAIFNADHNRCAQCQHGKACLSCESSVNGHANIFRRK